MDANVATRVAVDSETIRFITTLRVDGGCVRCALHAYHSKSQDRIHPRLLATANGPASVFFLLIGMTAIGATSPFGHLSANGGSPPERTPSAGTNRQILSTR